MDEFFTWAMLATYAGAVLATTIITQFIKGFSFLQNIKTQLISYLIALIVMLLATLFTAPVYDVATFAIIPFNAILVSVAANGTFNLVTNNKTVGKDSAA